MTVGEFMQALVAITQEHPGAINANMVAHPDGAPPNSLYAIADPPVWNATEGVVVVPHE